MSLVSDFLSRNNGIVSSLTSSFLDSSGAVDGVNSWISDSVGNLGGAGSTIADTLTGTVDKLVTDNSLFNFFGPSPVPTAPASNVTAAPAGTKAAPPAGPFSIFSKSPAFWVVLVGAGLLLLTFIFKR